MKLSSSKDTSWLYLFGHHLFVYLKDSANFILLGSEMQNVCELSLK